MATRPKAIQMFAERIGVTKKRQLDRLQHAGRLPARRPENKAHRGMAVLDPVKLVLTNWDETLGASHLETLHPARPAPQRPD